MAGGFLTERRGVILGENVIFGSVGVEEQQVVEIADAVGQRANGEVFGCVGHEVPDHSLTWNNSTTSGRSSVKTGTETRPLRTA